jgi:hypothetical protein
LWFSERKAKDGKFFFVPLEGGKKIAKCTEITMDKEPPSESSKFLSAAYLPLS